jgi:DNA/RNA endonuclease YhcR with UshA esterase domain
MRNSEVVSLSLAIATAGLLMLFFAASLAEAKEVSIGELSSAQLGATVKVAGEVVRVKNHEAGHVFLRIRDGTGEVSVPLFKRVAEDVNKSCLREGARIEVIGRLEEYRGELEVVPREGDEVRCLR